MEGLNEINKYFFDGITDKKDKITCTECGRKLSNKLKYKNIDEDDFLCDRCYFKNS